MLLLDDGGFLMICLWAYLMGHEAWSALFAVLCHEWGHLAALLCCGAAVRCIRIGITGPDIRYGGDALSCGQRLICLLAGPCVNLAAAIWLPPGNMRRFQLYFGLFNLLPLRQLDGGGALALFLPGTAGLYTDIAALAGLVLYGIISGQLIAVLPVLLWTIWQSMLAKSGGSRYNVNL